MTATVLDREHLPRSSEPVVGSRNLERPPTLFGRESDWDVVQAGYDIARRAIGYAMENVALPDAIASLAEDAPSPDALRMAFDYLAYTRFEDVPRSEQVEAFFIVEDARAAYDRRSRTGRAQRLRSAWTRLRAWWSESMRRWGELYERNGADPFGGPLLPV